MALPNIDSSRVHDWFREGFVQLRTEVEYRWLQSNWELAESNGLKQCDVAIACNEMHESTFGKYLNGQRSLTKDAIDNLTIGFLELSRRYHFKIVEIDPPMSVRLRATAGWIHAVNCAGDDFPTIARRRPLGVLHYYCLRTIYGDMHGRWMTALQDQLSRVEIVELVKKTLEKANENTETILHVLEKYERATVQYPVIGTFDSLKELIRTWTDPWRVVYNVLGDAP